MSKYKTTLRKKVASKKSFCDKLNGADDVYLTRTKIAVRKTKSDNRGRIISDTTKYFPKTKANLSCVGKLMGRIRYGR